VVHGNQLDPARQIIASFENTGAWLLITLADQGKGFDPDLLSDPLAAENLLRGSGRGIFLMRSFMDEVHFRQLLPGTGLTLVKRLALAGKNIKHFRRGFHRPVEVCFLPLRQRGFRLQNRARWS
jgi:serine/threonine-protein kinase RsbW